MGVSDGAPRSHRGLGSVLVDGGVDSAVLVDRAVPCSVGPVRAGAARRGRRSVPVPRRARVPESIDGQPSGGRLQVAEAGIATPFTGRSRPFTGSSLAGLPVPVEGSLSGTGPAWARPVADPAASRLHGRRTCTSTSAFQPSRVHRVSSADMASVIRRAAAQATCSPCTGSPAAASAARSAAASARCRASTAPPTSTRNAVTARSAAAAKAAHTVADPRSGGSLRGGSAPRRRAPFITVRAVERRGVVPVLMPPPRRW